ncbi:MAG TPA: lipid-binding SYLF domain-containing protein [Casimicrobiaceae bacterium]|nr:lipid-binding SYLF domain-containing protein [Casimicrobiaceae bacterium]
MTIRSIAQSLRAVLLLSCAFCLVAPVAAQTTNPQKLVTDAQTTLNNFLRDPAQTWIHDNIGRAKALLIVPQIVKVGFIFGGSGGQGVLVARSGNTWVGPAFYDLATASVGFQAGVEVSEAVIVVMTEKGLNSLMATTFKVGGDASIAAGPVGAGAKSTVTADLVSFTRAKGIYGGVNLDGTVVHANGDWNSQFYGAQNVLPPDILIRKTYKSAKAAPLLAAVSKIQRK